MRKSKMKPCNKWKKEHKGLGFYLNRRKEPVPKEIPIRREVFVDKKDKKIKKEVENG